MVKIMFNCNIPIWVLTVIGFFMVFAAVSDWRKLTVPSPMFLIAAYTLVAAGMIFTWNTTICIPSIIIAGITFSALVFMSAEFNSGGGDALVLPLIPLSLGAGGLITIAVGCMLNISLSWYWAKRKGISVKGNQLPVLPGMALSYLITLIWRVFTL